MNSNLCRKLWHGPLVAVGLCGLLAGPLAPGVAGAATVDQVSDPYRGVRYTRRTVRPDAAQPNLRPQNIFVTRIDLADPAIRFTVSEDNGFVPDPANPARDANRQVNLETTRAFVARAGAQNGGVGGPAQVGMNLGFFDNSVEAQVAGFTSMVSLAASNGTRYSNWSFDDIAFNIGADNDFDIMTRKSPSGASLGLGDRGDDIVPYNATSGSRRILTDGVNTGTPGPLSDYPQTAIGASDRDAATGDYRYLYLIVSDGRRSGGAAGLQWNELAAVLLDPAFGVDDALALDGGGSATMVLTDPLTNIPGVVNNPSDGIERRVGNSLAVFAAPVPEPATLQLLAAGAGALLGRRRARW